MVTWRTVWYRWTANGGARDLNHGPNALPSTNDAELKRDLAALWKTPPSRSSTSQAPSISHRSVPDAETAEELSGRVTETEGPAVTRGNTNKERQAQTVFNG
ncbi:hypothetical protein SKAU_G00246790 [Synaphobranchus kaupii]|uniref:Uncharacterized protein n=1 Tax=Synaphobranchus kaupii TaxID=118154 RepID=A0A9Q1IPE6_SYNKA|nr:hypothetical protein SKAU_G00246790 [Synaphobranchus kaupii]